MNYSEYILSYSGDEIDQKLGKIDDLSKAIVNKIDTPTSAAINEVLSVKNIDKEGNITWETINLNTVNENIAIDATLSVEGSAADAKMTGDKLAAIESELTNLSSYKPINIISFTNNINTVEIGSLITNIELEWQVNKTPVALTLDGASIAPSLTSIPLNNLFLTTDKSWSLIATDERGNTFTNTTGVSFLNGIYYGAINSETVIDNDTILGLAKEFHDRDTKIIKFTATANTNQHIIYASPVSYGTPSFNVGGFNGGFKLYSSTFDFKNNSQYTEKYCIWISDNTGLGTTTVQVELRRDSDGSN